MSIGDLRFASRRQMLSLGAAAGMMTLASVPQTAHATGHSHGESPLPFNVRSFGAAGDAATDDTAAFQHALDAAFKAGGGSVYAPPGRYLLRGSLTVPDGVTLRGSYS